MMTRFHSAEEGFHSIDYNRHYQMGDSKLRLGFKNDIIKQLA